VLATIAFATLVLGYVETGRAAYGGGGVPAGATAVVAPDGTPGLSEDTVARIRRIAGPGVADPLATQVFAGRAGATPARGLRSVAPGTAAPTRSIAAANGWRLGDSVQVTLADGARRQLTIVAARPDAGHDGQDGAGIALPRSLVRAHDGSALTSRLALTGPTPDDLAAVTRPGVRALTAAEYGLTAAEGEYRLLLSFVLIGLGLALGYTLLSVANTLLMATAARARDLGLLRLAGATPRQVVSCLTWEALVTVALGTGLGLLAGSAGLLGIRAGLARELHRPVALALPWSWIAVLVAACAVLAWLATALPALRSVPPAQVTGS
jgi:putative ABC transport system permease protein